MPSLSSFRSYVIVKVAGENNGPNPNTGMFLVNKKTYCTRSEAELEAIRLATATPGNRYYIFQKVGGFMQPETPKMEEVKVRLY